MISIKKEVTDTSQIYSPTQNSNKLLVACGGVTTQTRDVRHAGRQMSHSCSSLALSKQEQTPEAGLSGRGAGGFIGGGWERDCVGIDSIILPADLAKCSLSSSVILASEGLMRTVLLDDVSLTRSDSQGHCRNSRPGTSSPSSSAAGVPSAYITVFSSASLSGTIWSSSAVSSSS